MSLLYSCVYIQYTLACFSSLAWETSSSSKAFSRVEISPTLVGVRLVEKEEWPSLELPVKALPKSVRIFLAASLGVKISSIPWYLVLKF